MTREVVEIIFVIDIIDLNFKILSLLKMILHVKTLHPGWAQVVHDDFSHSDSLPLLTNLLVKHNHAIGSREGIQIGQVLTSKAQTDGLYQAGGC